MPVASMVIASALALVVVSKLTKPLDNKVLAKFFPEKS